MEYTLAHFHSGAAALKLQRCWLSGAHFANTCEQHDRATTLERTETFSAAHSGRRRLQNPNRERRRPCSPMLTQAPYPSGVMDISREAYIFRVHRSFPKPTPSLHHHQPSVKQNSALGYIGTGRPAVLFSSSGCRPAVRSGRERLNCPFLQNQSSHQPKPDDLTPLVQITSQPWIHKFSETTLQERRPIHARITEFFIGLRPPGSASTYHDSFGGPGPISGAPTVETRITLDTATNTGAGRRAMYREGLRFSGRVAGPLPSSRAASPRTHSLFFASAHSSGPGTGKIHASAGGNRHLPV